MTGPAAAGFVLAGGRSSRMGRDKALLPWGPTTLLQHALARVRSVCADVTVLSGGPERYADCGVPVLADEQPDNGPLGGLVAALAHTRADLVLLLAVDVPFAPPALLRHLLDAAADADAVVPSAGGRPQPLCAVYRRTCLDAARRRLSAGERKMTSFWPDLRIRLLPEDALAAFGDPGDLLRNLNTPEDYERSRPPAG